MRAFLVFAGIVVMTLTGCAPEESTPTRPTPSATASDRPDAATPTAFVDLSCDELVSASLMAAVSASSLYLRAESGVAFGENVYDIPYDYSIRQEQGTSCLWTSDPVPVIREPRPDGFAFLRVTLLPDAEIAAINYQNVWGPFDPSPTCRASDSRPTSCEWNSLTADNIWIQVSFSGPGAAVDSAFSELAASVAAATSGAPRGATWLPPAPSRGLPAGCLDLLTAEVIEEALGTPSEGVGFADGPVGTTSLVYEAELRVGSAPCFWFTAQTASEYGNEVQILQGGEWAWEEARAGQTTIASAAALPLTGLLDGESAWQRTAYGMTTVDLVVGGAWISFSMSDEDVTALGLDGAPARLAQAFVDSLS